MEKYNGKASLLIGKVYLEVVLRCEEIVRLMLPIGSLEGTDIFIAGYGCCYGPRHHEGSGL